MNYEADGTFSEENLAQCETILRHRFQDRDLLRMCLTHASGAKHRLASNERLEFLGDAVLGLIVCEMLYRRFPESAEGEMTRVKSILVSRSTCAKISGELGCDRFLLIGKGLSTHERVPSSVRAAVFESLVAGVYLDGGLEAARELIEPLLEPELQATVLHDHGKNFKSLLQQHSQKSCGATPVYEVLDEKGPDHSKCFKVAATIGPHRYPSAWGPNKKEAEQRAAHNALHELQGKDVPYAAD